MGSFSSSSGSGADSASQVLDLPNMDTDAPFPIMSYGDGLAAGRACRRSGFIFMNAASSIFELVAFAASSANSPSKSGETPRAASGSPSSPGPGRRSAPPSTARASAGSPPSSS